MKLTAPWNDDLVEQLREYQDNNYMHSYTCLECGFDLTPTRQGWLCDICGFTQDWVMVK